MNWFPRDSLVEGREAISDRFRWWIEAGYDLGTIAIEHLREEMMSSLREEKARWDRAVQNLSSYEERVRQGRSNKDDKEFGDFEFRKDLEASKKALIVFSRRIRDLDRILDEAFSDKEEAADDEESIYCQMCKIDSPCRYKACKEKKSREGGYESRRFHYQGMHDLALRKEVILRGWLKRSTEEQDKKMLLRLDFLKSGGKRGKVTVVGQQLTGPWYYNLSMLVVNKHANVEKVQVFAGLEPEEKKKARRLPEFFWAAAFDRLRNFKAVNEKRALENGRTWGVPTDSTVLDMKMVEFDPEMALVGRNMAVSEMAMIETIDEKRNWFLRAAMKRAALMRNRRDRFLQSRKDWEAIKASWKEE